MTDNHIPYRFGNDTPPCGGRGSFRSIHREPGGASVKKTEKLQKWLLPAILSLLILQVILLPVVLGVTYATRSQRPEHILTYTAGKLKWDSNTAVTANGSGEINFFETLYQNVNTENAEKILAPGTEKGGVIRLKNDSGRSIRYTAVAYSVKSSELLAAEAELAGEGFTDTDEYTLPEGIERGAVIRAVEGTLDAAKMQDFDIVWRWGFEDADDMEARDTIDTYLGDKSADGYADDVTIGFYLVVHDGGDIAPNPKTGDNTMIRGYLVLMMISGVLLLELLISRRRKRCHEE